MLKKNIRKYEKPNSLPNDLNEKINKYIKIKAYLYYCKTNLHNYLMKLNQQ